MELVSTGEIERAPSAHRCCMLSCAYGQGAGGQELCFCTGSSGLLHIAQIPATAKQHKGRRSSSCFCLLSCRNACPPLMCHAHVTVWQTCTPSFSAQLCPYPVHPSSAIAPGPSPSPSTAFSCIRSARFCSFSYFSPKPLLFT